MGQNEVTIQDVINKKKEKTRRVDSKLILRAYEYAVSKHGDQKRKSGEPYIIHPLNVAYILAEIGLDEETLCAALLHDVVEETFRKKYREMLEVVKNNTTDNWERERVTALLENRPFTIQMDLLKEMIKNATYK